MKERKKHGKKFIVLLSIAVCLLFGYISIKNGSADTSTDTLITLSGYFSMAIAVVASVNLIRRTFTDLSTKRID